MHYRHRVHYGEPLFSLQFKGQELLSPDHLGDCVFWREHPDLDFPEVIQKIRVEEELFYSISSKYSCYTNNPSMYKIDFARSALLPFCDGNIEGPHSSLVEETGLPSISRPGAFSDNRLDC